MSRRVHKTERSLPSSPRKKLFPKKSIFVLYITSQEKKNELSEEEKEWSDNFPERSDIAFTTPGRRDTIYVGMEGGKRECKQIRNLLWKLHEVINGYKIITNGNFSSVTEAFERELSFHQMYSFLKMHIEVAYNSEISRSSQTLYFWPKE